MKVITPGSCYELDCGTVLHFPNETVAVSDCTTNEELAQVLLDRLKHLNKKLPCRENALAITKLQESQFWLEERTKLRQQQGVESTNQPHQS